MQTTTSRLSSSSAAPWVLLAAGAACVLGACVAGPATHPYSSAQDDPRGGGLQPDAEGAAGRGGGPRPAPMRSSDDDDGPAAAIERATRALEAGDVVKARVQLEEHLDDEPDDAQARYLLARALVAQGEQRAARRELERSLALDDRNALAWSLLAGLCEQMGEHRRALQAYSEVHHRVSESLDPMHGMARCLLFLGEAEGALSTLASARQRPVKDPLTEYLAFQATRRLDRPEEAEAVARGFLALLASRSDIDRAAHANTSAEVRRWLEQRSEPLDQDARRVLVEAARTGCKLRLPGAGDPEDDVLSGAPPRLFAFDERPVFVTFFASNGEPLRGRGRGKNLVAALKGALQAIQELPGYSPLAVKDAAVQLEIGHTLEPISIRPGPDGLVADPPLVRGLHGIALRVDRQEAYCLPSEGLTHALPHLAAMLTHATSRAGLSPEAWQGASAAFRFETDAWLSPAPGLAIARLELGEPTPLPQGLPGELRDAVQAGARWLTTQLRPTNVPANGSGNAPDSTTAGVILAGQHDPTGRSFDPSEATPAEGARVALACAGAHALSNDPVLLAAAEHLVNRLLPGLPPASAAAAGGEPGAEPGTGFGRLDDPVSRAELESSVLLTLGRLAAHRRTPSTGGETRRAIAEHLHARATPATRAHALLALAAELEHSDAPAAGAGAVNDLAPGLLREEARDAVTVLALVAIDEALPGLGAGEKALLWGKAQLDGAATAALVADPIARARHVAALARVARLAARRSAPETDRLRALTLEQARGLLTLQLGTRHRHFLRNADLALGGFRSESTRAELRPAVTAECVLALLACLEMMQG